jgi:hypothetical protein
LTTWRHFAAKTLPRVVSDLALPCATPRHTHEICPMHDRPIGTHTRLCDRCWDELWAEIGRRYAAQPGGATTERRTA